jgi:transposase
MAYIKGEARGQELLLPERLDQYVSEDNPVRFIDAFVDKLDMDACGFARGKPGEGRGRPNYDPRDLLKLYLYGYMNRTRSSRLLERACTINLEVIWLLGRLKPDHKTIAEFRRVNAKAFKAAFRRFVVLSRKLGMLGADLVAIDGTKLKAVNSPRKNLTRARLQRMMREADTRLEEYTKRLDDQDARDHNGRKSDKKKLRGKIEVIEKELEAMKDLEAGMERTGVKQISLTDAESRAMPKNPKVGVGYNAQAGVDEKHGVIVAEELSNDIHDYDQLEPVAKEAHKNLGEPEELKIVADKGYDKVEQMKACEEAGMRCYVASRELARQNTGTHYGKDAFRYLKTRDAYRCPAGETLSRYTQYTTEGKLKFGYHNVHACASCAIKSKCTASKDERVVIRDADEEIALRVRKRMETEPGVYKRRAPTVEKAFGSIKWAMGCDHLLMKGVEKCRGEWSLTCLAYNLKRAIATLGVQKLLEWARTALVRVVMLLSRIKTPGTVQLGQNLPSRCFLEKPFNPKADPLFAPGF